MNINDDGYLGVDVALVVASVAVAIVVAEVAVVVAVVVVVVAAAADLYRPATLLSRDHMSCRLLFARV